MAHLFYHIEFKVIDPFGCAAAIGDCSKATVDTETKRLQKRYRDLLDLLTSSPLLSHATKEVTIMRAHRLESSAWGTHEETYGDVLRQLKGVQVVRLKEVHFSHLSPSFVDALIDVCESGGVTRLEVLNCENSGLGNLTRIMRSLPSLQHLTLLLVHSTNTIDDEKHGEVPSAPSSSSGTSERGGYSPIRPSSLIIETSQAQTLADWLRYSPPVLDLSRLRELRFREIDSRVQIRQEDIDVFIGSCASSLEILEIYSFGDDSRDLSLDRVWCERCLHRGTFPSAASSRLLGTASIQRYDGQPRAHHLDFSLHRDRRFQAERIDYHGQRRIVEGRDGYKLGLLGAG